MVDRVKVCNLLHVSDPAPDAVKGRYGSQSEEIGFRAQRLHESDPIPMVSLHRVSDPLKKDFTTGWEGRSETY